MIDFETIARSNHLSGMNCSNALYDAFKYEYELEGTPPPPRSEGGMCGALLTGIAILKETGNEDKVEDFTKAFIDRFRYTKCKDLILHKRVCNDNIGFVANYLCMNSYNKKNK